MNITLYRNTSEEAVVSKSISTYGTYTCKLQEPCTLEEPKPTAALPNDMITSIGDTYYSDSWCGVC